ncbi:beta-glucosidase [Terrimicrobium sacchariphilum]|uniref:Beta-glucosidase n=1 Tax=Terrimicrobium sacchariphilum TaxID=690879 RepID=A0A146GBB3_TERSA|nr:GH1 family beta-glucosidase [Terrimicrobium sacchariphilum]GAT34671.1 beta-glucosidase [Terrimicrobium sacchariphilum]
MTFPERFVWGASTSAYQIEGAWNTEGKGLSIWDMYTRNGEHVRDGHSGREACDHYHRGTEDIALFSQIGINAYRFSISWPRVIPAGIGSVNRKGLDFYDRLVDNLLAAGITPWVTLFHWDLPYALFLHGGWLSPDSPAWFEEYVTAVVRRLSDRVQHWVTLSDPQCFIGMGYGTGEHAPGLRLDLPEILLASHHALLAHGKSVQAIRAHARTPASICWSPSATIFYPYTDSPADTEAARKATFSVFPEAIWNNTWLSDPVVFGRYPEDGLRAYGAAVPKIRSKDMETIHQPIDIYGCNIFQGTPVKAGPDGLPMAAPFAPGHAETACSWKQTPEAIYWGLRFLNKHYQLPVVITKNGIASADSLSLDGKVHDAARVDFLNSHLLQVRRALQDGIDVRGYFYWSAMDNFEWQNGYSRRFGLIYVDHSTQRRSLKESAIMYRSVITSNGGELDTFLPANDEQMPFLVKEAIRYIQDNLATQFTIRELATTLRCHPDYLGRKFKQHTGVELGLYIRRARVDQARELLKDHHKTIDDIAEDCGFTDRIHFAKVFKKLTGDTPGKYRRILNTPATSSPLWANLKAKDLPPLPA